MTPDTAASPFTCPHCGSPGAIAGWRFCTNCGEALPQAAELTSKINVIQQVGQVSHAHRHAMTRACGGLQSVENFGKSTFAVST